MIYTDKKDELIPALFKARKAMSSGAKKNTQNNHLKNKYANLESFLHAIRPALEAEGLMIQQSWEVGAEKNVIYLNTEVMHISGQSMQVTSPFPISKADAHGMGSAITYARRYAIACIFGIAQADDDGNATRKTSTDVVKSLEQAETVEQLSEIYRIAMGPKYFGGDSAAGRVITAKYNERKNELIKPGEGFRPSAARQAPQPVDEPQLAQDAAPSDFNEF